MATSQAAKWRHNNVTRESFSDLRRHCHVNNVVIELVIDNGRNLTTIVLLLYSIVDDFYNLTSSITTLLHKDNLVSFVY